MATMFLLHQFQQLFRRSRNDGAQSCNSKCFAVLYIPFRDVERKTEVVIINGGDDDDELTLGGSIKYISTF